MRAVAIAAFAAALFVSVPALSAEADEGDQPKKDEAAAAAASNETRQLAPLQAREVIERLKTMRAQLLLEQEYNRLLEARLARQDLENKLASGGGKEGKKDKDKPAEKAPEKPAFASRPLTPPPNLENASEQLVVKAVTVAPFKEAIVTYKGRVYTVRPGDRLGNIEVRDINDSGVVTSGGKTNMLGQ